MDVATLRDTYNRIVGKKEAITNQLEQKLHALTSTENELESSVQALEIIQKVSLKVQQSLKFRLEAPVNNAIATVLDEPLEFEAQFEVKRNKTSCNLNFKRDDKLVDKNTGTGGTVLDLASIALRTSLFELQRGVKSDRIMILDEPSRNVSHDKKRLFSELLKTLSTRLNMQFIVVSHDEQIINDSDNTIRVTLKNKVSKVQIKEATH
jgi:hypothetical protein